MQAESDLLTLRSTVDSVANYEDMIETLAGECLLVWLVFTCFLALH